MAPPAMMASLPDFSSPQILLPLLGIGVSLALLVGVGLYILLDRLIQEPSETKIRLYRVIAQDAQTLEMVLTTQEKLERLKSQWIEKLIPKARSLYGNNNTYLEKVRSMLMKAGRPDSDEHVYLFLANRLFYSFIWGAIGFAGGLASQAFSPNLTNLMLGALGGAVIGGMLPQMKLRGEGAARTKAISRSLPDVLDIMVVCVEAGLGLDATMQRVSKEGQSIAPDLSREFTRVIRDMNAGVSRQEAFQQLAYRNEVDELRSLTTMIIQSDKLGTSIGETLRIFSEEMRTKRKQKAEELAAKAGIKMTFPLVFFVFPPLMIILIGPTVIQALKTFKIL
jgi:tight adherence protein C